MTPYQDRGIAAAFEAFEPETRAALSAFREVIFDVAGGITDVTGIQESLKWGQPSYAPTPKTGTPIRLGVSKSGAPTLFVHCQTTLVADLEADNAYGLVTIDNRAVLLPEHGLEEHPGLRNFVRAALTYHL